MKYIASAVITKPKIMWGRWCLPNFNSNCDQLLKGALADMDNHLCDGQNIKSGNKLECMNKEIIP